MDSKLFLVLQGSEVGRACCLTFFKGQIYFFSPKYSVATRAGRLMTEESHEKMAGEPTAAGDDGMLGPGPPTAGAPRSP